jgi:hypothetical protein
MRTITTDYNNSAYASATKFTCVYSANGLTVAAGNPVNVRSMFDSVGAGDYVASATSMEIDSETSTPDVDGTDTITITAKISTTATAGIPVRAISDDPTVATVSPALARTKANGTVDFVITAVGADTEEATITFKTYGADDVTCAVTITED